ncbi:MAG: hypothetical protein IPK75_12865 [Acidobacteria bacterium]|nr:hypothetical protein [Acidobacteriota bacterium]
MPNAHEAPWGRYMAVMTALGAASVYLINNWGNIEPVLESPSVIVLSMLSVFGLGGLSAYWLLARPHEDRLRRAETVINRLRDQERQLLQREGDLKAQVAALEATVSFLKEEMADLRRRLDRDREPRGRTTKPKG